MLIFDEYQCGSIDAISTPYPNSHTQKHAHTRKQTYARYCLCNTIFELDLCGANMIFWVRGKIIDWENCTSTIHFTENRYIY